MGITNKLSWNSKGDNAWHNIGSCAATCAEGFLSYFEAQNYVNLSLKTKVELANFDQAVHFSVHSACKYNIIHMQNESLSLQISCAIMILSLA